MDSAEAIAPLVSVVQRVVEESGSPAGFDAESWLARWMSEEVPALGFKRPVDLLNEPGGFERIRTTLMAMQSGAYF
ncbi:DUF2384 domain-containing protein [Caenimonas sedimenti]|uniref:DUF2384 domain-containing protein n=1 Tax=Caenimonas sedimenti TaxID=2596921 RepID=A0A562ZI76_9BURK|nr:MbcA/ParS/Xre antitoxin family protein [Caenimonas sedimenti]TWO68087.1 DUF2384 domain-containing protein [Caenimonas sedimenti]